MAFLDSKRKLAVTSVYCLALVLFATPCSLFDEVLA